MGFASYVAPATRVLTADNGKRFEVEREGVLPQDLKAGDEVFYSFNRLGYATILAVGRTFLKPHPCGDVELTRIIAFWNPDCGASEWRVSQSKFLRIVREVSP
ncbi:hypothetical protein OG897_08405 [Streptomyces sp. NBC_00237]|uniref:hypothetical protein n=1 Tax=Streptomyces sp. NBC_00237 TaxID=2975687 RepID=UPI00225A7E62|nr:hypothetical protein [Streptomyces sp. NBC_00237]MCX5201472.1 hypothetical protein [Streptomyces sp. NBC_00237]